VKRERAYIDAMGNLHSGEISFSLRRDPERWQEWLDAGQGFQIWELHVDGYGVPMCSVRLKRIKGLGFWYAERKRDGYTRSVHIGKTSALTLDRLWWAADQLVNQKREKLAEKEASG
jgi:hypothetical protein